MIVILDQQHFCLAIQGTSLKELRAHTISLALFTTTARVAKNCSLKLQATQRTQVFKLQSGSQVQSSRVLNMHLDKVNMRT